MAYWCIQELEVVFYPTNDPRRRTLKASLLEVRAWHEGPGVLSMKTR
jgi:hypothetical protein